MSEDKEEILRRKVKSSLDAKGWEALLEGVPSIEEEGEKQEFQESAESEPEAPPSPEKHVLKVTDPSGEVSEQVTSVPPSPSASTPLPIETEPSSSFSSSAAAEEEKEEEAKTSLSRLWGRLRQHPIAHRILQYYRGLNPREQKIILAGLIFLSGLFVYAAIIDPMSEKNTLLNRQIQKKNQELAEMVRLSSSVVQDRGGMEHIKKVIEQRGKGFSVFAYLEQLANKAEMKDKIIYIKPQRETPVGSFRESLAEIKLAKISLEELTRYLYQIESSEDLLYIKNLKLKTGRRGKDQEGLEATLSVGTLVQ